MELLRRCCCIDDLHIVLRAHLKETLHTRRGVLRALPFETMRQQYNQAVHTVPFVFGRRKILVENDLRTVEEVAELCFPDGKDVWRCKCIAVFKTENTIFAEQ